MPRKYKRYFLKAREAKSLLRKSSEKLQVDLEEILNVKSIVEVIETDFFEVLLIDGKPLLAKADESIFPTLIFDKVFALMPKVVVDMGAVPYVCDGANVMAPGIVRFEGEFRRGNLVFVVDEKHGKPIAVGKIIYDVDTAEKVKKGIVVKNIHFVGDKVWNFIKKMVATI